MTNWLPDLSGQPGPKYKAIADAIARDISDGRLAEDQRLPTHRDLAWRLGVTIGTVSRAYALAQSWGLIAGEVGRGTRVTPPGGGAAMAESGREHLSPVPTFFPSPDRQTIEMSRNYPADEHTNTLLADGLRKLANPRALARLGGYHSPTGTQVQREAGARWLEFCGVQTDPGHVVVVNGCQHALWVAFATLARAGDTVMTEELTWPGVVELADTLGLTVRPVAMDGFGLRPDAFEEACREGQAKILYTVPTMQNPTATIMPETRRNEIAAIARAHGVTILEDSVFGFLMADAPPSFMTIAPDITVYATSLSKAVSPALRTGYLVGTQSMIPQFASVVRAMTIMPPMLSAQLSTEMMFSGAVAEAARRQRGIAAERLALATEILGSHASPTHPNASQLWLALPSQWSEQSFLAEALTRGVAVSAGSAFKADPQAKSVGFVRVCLCAEPDADRIRKGLMVLAELLNTHPTAGAPIV